MGVIDENSTKDKNESKNELKDDVFLKESTDKGDKEHSKEERPKEQNPKEDHPKEDHPKEDHPKEDLGKEDLGKEDEKGDEKGDDGGKKKKVGEKSGEKSGDSFAFPTFQVYSPRKVFENPSTGSSSSSSCSSAPHSEDRGALEGQGVPPSDPPLLPPPSAPKRRSSSSSGNFVCNDPYRSPEMSPEMTLIEFISTSAAFHGVKKQDIKQLEWDILKVFTNNVMPANAAAWYMAKRRFYIHNSWENQLLPFLLKKYPDKFYVRGQIVEFLDTYSKDIARKKMYYMVNQGLYAYFSHKAEEYGVYFFDPYYYENTEPFHANLRLATHIHTGHRSKLIPSFFNQYKNQFVFTKHSPYLVTISKGPTKMKINTTGIIVKMIDNNYGLIQFPSGSGTEIALFSLKALYTDGWQYNGDPLKLDAVKFDGYMIPANNSSNADYTWYAVLVWCGRKPSPKFCATKDELTSYRLNRRLTPPTSIPNQQLPTTTAITETLSSPKQDGSNPTEIPAIATPSKPKVDDSMIIGEILEIKRNGAVVSMKKESIDEKAFIPGWRRENLRRKGSFLTTTTGVGLSLKDLVGYYLDPNQIPPPNSSFKGIAHNLIVLKHAQVEFVVTSPNTRHGIFRNPKHPSNVMENKSGNKNVTMMDAVSSDVGCYIPNGGGAGDPSAVETLFTAYNIKDGAAAAGGLYENNDEDESSNYDSFDEAEDISDGELNFLRDGINDFISQHSGQNSDAAHHWRTINFLQKVMQDTNNAINTRNLRRGVMNRPVTPGGTSSSGQDSGITTSAEVTPKEDGRNKQKKSLAKKKKKSTEAFWRMKNAFKCLEKYNSDDDPSYEPSDSEAEDRDIPKKNNLKIKGNALLASPEKSKDKKSSLVKRKELQILSDILSPKNIVRNSAPQDDYAIWVNCVMGSGIKFCPHNSKWLIDQDSSSTSKNKGSGDSAEVDSEDDDHDYVPPTTEYDHSSDEEEISEEELKELEEDLKKDPVGVPDEQEEENKDQVDEKDDDKDESEEASAKSNDSIEVNPANSEHEDKKPSNKKSSKKGLKKRSGQIPLWVKAILQLEPKKKNEDKKVDESKEEESKEEKSKDEEKVDKKEIEDATDNEKKESEDEYDSDVDVEFYPGPYIMDIDVDYDEYSDGEIPDDEIEALKKEANIQLTEEFVGRCMCDYVPPKSDAPKKEEKEVLESKDTVDENSASKKEEEVKEEKAQKAENGTEEISDTAGTVNIEKKDEEITEKKDEEITEKIVEDTTDKKDENSSSSSQNKTSPKKGSPKKGSPKKGSPKKGGKKKSK